MNDFKNQWLRKRTFAIPASRLSTPRLDFLAINLMKSFSIAKDY